VEFWDDRDRDLAVSPLGMPPDADWVLYHPNPDRDSSLIQNSWTYALSESIGHWAAEFRFAEAFVHQDGGSLSLDDHHGLVVVLEKVKLTPDRLDVTPLSDDGSTGGWLLGINRVDAEPVGGGEPQSFHTAGPDRVYESTPNSFGGGDDIPIQWNAFINFDDPDGYEISDDQRAEIEGWFVDMEDVLYAPGWRDPVTGYAAWLDVEDFIDYFLIHDLTRNTDGLLISLWCYLDDADGRLHMGPPWDYDLAFSDRPESNLLINAQHLWYDRLFDDPAFVDAYAARWQELRTGPFADQELVGLIDSQAAEVSAEVAARTGLDDWPERVDDMADFVVARAAALDALLR
jgi:hypothetical protein